jgi:polyhydroxybutyrate depolymerase
MRLFVPAALLSLIATAAGAALPPGDHTIDIGDRSYIAHIPPGAETARPVVINMHGGGSNAAQQQKYSQMDPLADREHFIVVYPNGTGRAHMFVWNAGTCCGRAPMQRIDDVAFVRSVIDDLGHRTPIDRTRIYATGMSNGSMMSYRLAAEASDLVAAIAPVAGSMVVLNFKPKLPVPIMHMHSVDDPRALYNGGLGLPFPGTQYRVFHQPVEQQLDKWIAFNGCTKTATIARTIKSESTSATKYVYGPCKSGATVILWKLTGSGHVWPGSEPRLGAEKILGKPNMLINADEEMWAFFKSFHR